MAHAPRKTPTSSSFPDLGEGLAEAELIKWRVEVGQTVNELDVLAEMETDKALVEVTSPRGGDHRRSARRPWGGHQGRHAIGHIRRRRRDRSGQGGQTRPPPKSSAVNGTHSEPKPAPRVVEEPAERTADAGTVVGDMSGGLAGISAAPGKALATPAVRRLARDLNVDIDGVSGTGIGGRVLEKDVRAAAGGSKQSPAKSAPVHHAGENEVGDRPPPWHPLARRLLPVARAGTRRLRSAAKFPRSPPGRTRSASHSGVSGRTIANRLRESVDRAVHFTVMDEADISALDVLRKKLAAASGEKLSVLPFVASAICRVLSRAEFRSLNATIEEKEGSDDAAIIQHRAVHLGIATDTDNGLMVPVIRDCDRPGRAGNRPPRRPCGRRGPPAHRQPRAALRLHVHPQQRGQPRRTLRHADHQLSRVRHPRGRASPRGAGSVRQGLVSAWGCCSPSAWPATTAWSTAQPRRWRSLRSSRCSRNPTACSPRRGG